MNFVSFTPNQAVIKLISTLTKNYALIK